MSSRLSTPPGWGNDTLTAYLEEFRGNQFATFHNKRQQVADLIAESGGAKVGHGSGGIMLLRAE